MVEREPEGLDRDASEELAEIEQISAGYRFFDYLTAWAVWEALQD